MEATSLHFAAAARVLGQAARRAGLEAPAFRAPPRVAGVERTLRRGAGGETTVAVRLRGRSWLAVLADMVEGVVAANRLAGGAADRCRNDLWRAAEACAGLPLEPAGTVGSAPGWRNRQTQAA